MKTQVMIAITALMIGTAAVVSFCSPRSTKKSPQHPTARATTTRITGKSAVSSSGSADGKRPIIEVQSAVGQPYDLKREARDNKYEQLVEQGDRALASNPQAAENYYRQASLLIAYRPDAWLGMARATDAQGKSAEALPYYRQAFAPPSGAGLYSSFPADVASFARYGTLCEETGQHEEAAKIYNQSCDRLNPKPDVPLQAANLSPQQLRALLDVVRGIALAESRTHSGQDRDGEALQAFQAAAQQYPNDARVQFYLGHGLRKAGQFAQAQAAFQRAAQLDTEGTVKAATEENLRAVQAHRR